MKLRALVVDSDPVERHNSIVLIQEAGYQAVGAASLQQARHLLVEQAFDLIILEIVQPDGNGLLLCNELRMQLESKAVIILTCKDTKPSLGITGLELGADDFVVKPYDTAELLARIAARFRRISFSTSG